LGAVPDGSRGEVLFSGGDSAVRVEVFFLAGMDAGFGFITAIPCYQMRLTSLGRKVTRTNRPMQREFSSKWTCQRLLGGVYYGYSA
jgi:hypothetical protein